MAFPRDALQFPKKKSARELRQRGSNYRCCIPALAGFVSPQSIAPDGTKKSPEPLVCAMWFSAAACAPLTPARRFVCIAPVKCGALLLILVLCLQCSCTTLVTRR